MDQGQDIYMDAEAKTAFRFACGVWVLMMAVMLHAWVSLA